MKDKKTWELKEWNNHFGDHNLPVMTDAEIKNAINWLRNHHYPKPTDCDEFDCPDRRPACTLGICRVAIGMCEDF